MFDNHLTKICRKVSQQIAVLKRMKKMLPFEIRRDLYLAFTGADPGIDEGGFG